MPARKGNDGSVNSSKKRKEKTDEPEGEPASGKAAKTETALEKAQAAAAKIVSDKNKKLGKEEKSDGGDSAGGKGEKKSKEEDDQPGEEDDQPGEEEEEEPTLGATHVGLEAETVKTWAQIKEKHKAKSITLEALFTKATSAKQAAIWEANVNPDTRSGYQSRLKAAAEEKKKEFLAKLKESKG